MMKNDNARFTTITLLFAWLFAMLISGSSIASTADHGQFKELDVDFKTGPEVTKACLS